MKLLGHVVVLLLVFWGTCILLHGGCTSSHSHQQYTQSSLSFSPHCRQHVFFLMTAVLTDVRSFPTVVLICIPLKVNDSGFLFINDTGHTYVFFGKCLFRLFCPFLNWICCCCCYRVVWVFLPILNISPSLDIWFANIFPHSVGCIFSLLMVSFVVQKLFSLM